MNFTEIVCVIILLVFAIPVSVYLSFKMGTLGYLHAVHRFYEQLLHQTSRQKQKQRNHQEGDENGTR